MPTRPQPDQDATPVAVAALTDAPPAFAPVDAERQPGQVYLPPPLDMRGMGLVRTMPAAEYAARLALLRSPFPAEQMEKLPRQLRRDDQDRGRCGDGYSADGHDCGGWHARSIHLDYVGHAGITLRLLDADPLWTWEPVQTDQGVPVMRFDGAWITLTVLGMTRLGVGDAAGKSGPNALKEVIGDALRNAAMRFGVGTYLWSKSAEAQALKHGGEVDDPPMARVERPARATAAEDRQSLRQSQAAPAPAAPPLPPATAMAYRQRIIDTVHATAPGDQRDSELRAIRDELATIDGALQTPVPVPEPWQRGRGESAPLLAFIGAVRGERTRATAPEGNPDDDPWATPGAMGGQDA